VKKTGASGNQDALLSKMEELANLLQDAERLLKRYERGMEELVRDMKGESESRWARELPRAVPRKEGRKGK
jgi:hypothetical protein